MSTLAQVQDNISYMQDFRPLSSEESKIIPEAVKAYHDTWPVKIAEEEMKGVTLHGVPFSAILEAYNSCQIQPNPGFSCDNNYLKGQLAKTGLDIHGRLPEQSVVLNNGTDITDQAMEVEKWLIGHTF